MARCGARAFLFLFYLGASVDERRSTQIYINLCTAALFYCTAAVDDDSFLFYCGNSSSTVVAVVDDPAVVNSFLFYCSSVIYCRTPQ